jgi:hypothetical protein
MTEHYKIKVVCGPHHSGEKPTNVATFSHQDGQWTVSASNPAVRRPSKPGKPLRVYVPLGPDGYPGGKLRCDRCGETAPPISLAVLNGFVQQGVSQKTLEDLRLLGSK